MIRRGLLAASLAALAVAGLTCIGCDPGETVMIVRSAPDPRFREGKFVVVPIDFAGLRVGAKSEDEYLSGKDASEERSFEEDKAGINERFTKALIDGARDSGIRVDVAAGPQDGPFVIRPSVKFIEGGFYAGMAGAPSKVAMNVKITTPDGSVLDETSLAHSTPATLAQASSGGRLRDDGSALGTMLAKYLASLVRPR